MIVAALSAAGLPSIPTEACNGLLDPICQAAGSVGSSLLSAGAGDVLSAVSTWVVEGASWLLGQIGGALTSSTTVDLGAGWYTTHYQAMAGLAAVVALPLLILSAVQAVYRQNASVLVRVVAVQLPLAGLLTAVAVQLVQLSLAATDALSSTVSSGVGTDIQEALSGVAGALVSLAGLGPNSPPAFVVLLGALLVVLGSFLLWVELLVRAAAVYVALLFLPLALASLVWPAISHWCRRLVDTLVALVLAKFVIVAVLSLAASALASGTQAGFASVLGGGAIILLAAFTPFTLLRLIPAVEAGAVQQLEGARHRVQQGIGSLPRSAASHALKAARASSLVPGEPGTGLASTFGVPGGDGGEPVGGEPDDSPASGEGVGGGATSGPSVGGGGTPAVQALAGVPQWRGVPPPGPGALGTLPAPPRLPWAMADPLGRGPLPAWGAPVPELDTAAPAGKNRVSSEGLDFAHDGTGPVIARWGTGDDAGRGDGGDHGDGRNGGGGSGGA